MEQILLTGAGSRGFIGRNIAPALKEKYEVWTPSSKELNLCDYDAVEDYIHTHHIDTVIHGAAQSVIHTGPNDAMLHDLQMFYNLEKLSGQLNKILFFGSGAEFDKRLPMDMIREEEFGRSGSDWYYALSKYIMTREARNSKNIYNLRLFGVFGKYEHWQSKFISNLCCKAVYDLPLTVRQNCMFDYLYVCDLPEIVSWFIDNKPAYHDYNVCTGKPVDLVSIASIVNKVAGKELPILVAKEGWNLSYTASNDRLVKEMGRLQLHMLEDAVAELYEYYSANRDLISYDELKETR